MAVNLVTNTQAALNSQYNLFLTGLNCSSLLDERQFVSNRVHKIQQHHIPTEGNEADLGSRGGYAINFSWKEGPAWLPSPETTAKAKIKREVVAVAV